MFGRVRRPVCTGETPGGAAVFPRRSLSIVAPRPRMVDLARLDELRRQYAEHPRRYFAPLASALRRAGDAPAAVELVRRALVDAPEHLTGYVILGQALADVGDRVGARRAFERAHELDDGNVVALQSLVAIARATGDEAASDRWAALLREADPEPAHAAQRTRDEQPDDAVRDDFELLDYVEVTPSSVPPAGDAPGYAAVDPPDPIVGLDEAPADPLPTPIREALPALLDAATPDVTPVTARPTEPASGEREVVDFASYAFDAEAAPATPPAAPFVTETMAGLLAAQGHTDQALDVYAQLLAQRPGDPRLLAQVAALRGEQPAQNASVELHVGPPDSGPNASDALAAAVQDDVADQLVEDSTTAHDAAARDAAARDADERAAQMWRASFAAISATPQCDLSGASRDAPAVTTEPPADVAPPAVTSAQAATEPSLDDLSFDHFFEAFGEETGPSPTEPAGEFERWAEEVDRRPAPERPEAPAAPSATPAMSVADAPALFASAASPASPAAPLGSSAPPDDPDADLDEFNAWLRSLAA